jgi:hypothetical protein
MSLLRVPTLKLQRQGELPNRRPFQNLQGIHPSCKAMPEASNICSSVVIKTSHRPQRGRTLPLS